MTPKRRSSNNLVVQGSILAGASLVVRLIGFFYRIPLVNILGEEGMGYYSSAFGLYSFMLVISSYAFPAALSKIISKKYALKKYKEAHEIFKAALLLGALIGLVTSSLMFFQAANIAKYIIGVEAVEGPLRALAPALLIFSIMAVFRGYFQGMNTMVPTAISQIIEQIFNAIFSLSLGYAMLKINIESGATGGTLGTGIGAFTGLIFLVFVFFAARSTIGRRIHKDQSFKDEEKLFDYWQIILMTVVPMLLGSTAYNLSSLVDNVLFQRALIFQGETVVFAASQYGVLTSKYLLLLTLPISLATALGTASIPSITASLVKKDFVLLKSKIKVAIQVVLIVSIPAACGLGFLAKPILQMLFGLTNLDSTAFLLQLGAFSVVTYSLSAISVALLQGLNKLKVPVKHALIAIGIKIILTIVFLYIFNMGLMGAVINSILFSVIIAVLNFTALRKQILLKIDYKVSVGIPAISGIIMGIVSVIVHMMMMAMTSTNWIATLVSILVAVIVYVSSLIGFGGLTEEILSALPMGNRLLRTANRFHWL